MPSSRRRAPASRRREETAVLTIDHVGAQGDGVAFHAGRKAYVPHTAAGDVVQATILPGNAEGDRGRVEELITAGPGRRTPLCRHAAVCGGCVVQHLDDETYGVWKLGLLRDALTRAGFPDAPIAPMIKAAPGQRRRARLALLRRGRHVFAGYNQRMSKLLTDLEECPVLADPLTSLLPQLRATMREILADGEACDAALTLLDGGLDLLLIGPARLDLDARMRLAAFADAADLARLSWKPDDAAAAEPVAARRPVYVDFGGVRVAPPPGGFLQATASGEAALRDFALSVVGDAGKAADLFCGAGAFALALAAKAKVTAFDSDGAAVAALAAGARNVGRPVEATRRDLFRDPLSPIELNRFDVVVFDPPRAGAAAQVAELARSQVPVLAAISCNPASFARDARTLAAAGWRLTRVLPVDQFLWSAHLELAAEFRRG